MIRLKLFSIHISEGSDFSINEADCRSLQFTRKTGIQKKCIFVRIIEDQIDEGTEQFSVNLTSSNPHVTFKTQIATVRIVEGEVAAPSQG